MNEHTGTTTTDDDDDLPALSTLPVEFGIVVMTPTTEAAVGAVHEIAQLLGAESGAEAAETIRAFALRILERSEEFEEGGEARESAFAIGKVYEAMADFAAALQLHL